MNSNYLSHFVDISWVIANCIIGWLAGSAMVKAVKTFPGWESRKYAFTSAVLLVIMIGSIILNVYFYGK